MFSKCLPAITGGSRAGHGNSESSMSAVRLSITINDTKGCRKVSVKGIYGDKVALKRFIDSFKEKLHYLAKADNKKNSKPMSVKKR
jgi:hypothetical protein